MLKVPEAFFKKVSPGGLGTFSWTVSTSDGTLSSKASATPCSFGWDASRPGDPEVAPDTSPPADSHTCPTLEDPGLGSVQPIGARCSFTVAPPTGETVSGFEYQLNQSAPVTVDVNGPTTITVPVSRLVNTLTVIAFSPGGNLGEPKFVEFLGTGISPAAGDGDVTMDGTPDLVTVGGPGTALPSGAWLSTGRPGGGVNEAATDIGVNGLQTDDEAGTPKPSDWDGAQAVTGNFCGNGAQDVLAYFSADGSGSVVCNDGSASSIAPGNPTTIGESTAPYELPDGTFVDEDGTPATQVVTAGDTSGANTGLPDLLATMDNTLYLTYSFTANGYGFLLDPDWGTCASCYALTSLNTPDGTQDWDSWTLATTQLPTGTALYLWNPTTGELDLWTGLGISTDGTTLTTTGQIQLAAAGWNQNPDHPLTLQAADLDGTGRPSLRAVDRTTGQVTPYLFDGTTLTPQTAQTVSNPDHIWPLKDGVAHTAATTAADASGSLALTGSASGAQWDTDDVRGTVLTLDGTGTMSSTAALSMSAPFSLSLWAKPAAFGGVIASQDGVKNSGFLLYSQSDHTWSFCMATADTTRGYDCAAGGTAVIGQWAHLTATYDPATKVMDLFVDGRLVAHGRHTAVSGFTGGFTLGNDINNGARASFYSGSVSDVQTWNGTVLTIDQVTAMANLRSADPPYTFADLADYDGDGNSDVVAADTYGNLWVYQGSGAGKLVSGPLYIGTGFTGFTLVGVADFDKDGYADVIARAPDNTLRLFPGDAGHNLLTPTVTIGTGWGNYRFAGVRDFNKDGKPDVVAADPSGDLWLYPGTGVGAGLGTRVQLGNGWTNYALAGLADFDKDGNLDVIARDSAGILWNYHGNGSNDVSNPTQVGTGWNSYTFAGLNDFNGDGDPDAVARDSAGILWFYPRTATAWSARTQIGIRW
ncbi:FG-GAP-like repeat-containing protein [Streptomyces sp. NRRL F-5123]|uniref:FG-GAP-like repeat-containing protein n=1 Tax=Streptomyces sp. NRRL F-5123 TaxID=1463856 RepID=UPI0006937B8F|nr:FG-GAP-like repeat-containing protein [Streptomyces sp. NRRL F-5123]